MSATPLHPLDRATALDGAPGAVVRQAQTSDAYWTFISPFGGVSAATALRAVLEHPDRLGDPLALTVNFCAPIEKGRYAVHTKRVRANRSSQHWQVEFRQGEGSEPVLTASVVTAVRRETWSHRLSAAPAALRSWEETEPFPNKVSASWVSQYEFRFAEGAMAMTESMPDPPRSPRSVLWMKDAEPRPLDFISLAAMSDAFFGRLFQMLGRIPPFGTVSMTTYFHASAEELARHSSAPLAAVADAHVFHRSFGDQTAELYGAGGQLLATAMQVAYFRV
jgi:acyl-CoA thioesterase